MQKPFNENLLLAELKRVLRCAGRRGPGVCWWSRTRRLAQVDCWHGFAEGGSARCDHASTLQQAVDRCLLVPPDLLILDLTLPDGDGFSLVDWLRRQPTLQAHAAGGVLQPRAHRG